MCRAQYLYRHSCRAGHRSGVVKSISPTSIAPKAKGSEVSFHPGTVFFFGISSIAKMSADLAAARDSHRLPVTVNNSVNQAMAMSIASMCALEKQIKVLDKAIARKFGIIPNTLTSYHWTFRGASELPLDGKIFSIYSPHFLLHFWGLACLIGQREPAAAGFLSRIRPER